MQSRLTCPECGSDDIDIHKLENADPGDETTMDCNACGHMATVTYLDVREVFPSKWMQYADEHAFLERDDNVVTYDTNISRLGMARFISHVYNCGDEIESFDVEEQRIGIQ